MLRTGAQLDDIIEHNPLLSGGRDPQAARDVPGAPTRRRHASAALDTEAFLPDEFRVAGREVFVHCPHGYGRTKLNNAFFERALGGAATTRTWKTVTTLARHGALSALGRTAPSAAPERAPRIVRKPTGGVEGAHARVATLWPWSSRPRFETTRCTPRHATQLEAAAPTGDGALCLSGTIGPQVDITIPVYNEEADLEASVRRLHAYLSAALPFSFRITVADNASTDGTWAIARSLERRAPRTCVAVHLDEKGRGRALRHVWSTERRHGARLHGRRPVDRPGGGAPPGGAAGLGPQRRGHRHPPGARRPRGARAQA